MLQDLKWARRLDEELAPVDNVGRILLRAANLWEKNGRCITAAEDDHGRVCVILAISRSVGRSKKDQFEHSRLFHEAMDRLHSHLRFGPKEFMQGGLIHWNERSGISDEDAISTLRAAA